MIPKPENEKVSLIVYRKNDSPRFFECSRKKFIGYLIAIPSVFILVCLMIFGSLFTFKLSSEKILGNPSVHSLESPSNANENSSWKKEKEDFLSEIKVLKDAQQGLVEKFNQGLQKSASSLGELYLFNPIPNQKDLTSPALVSVNDLKIKTSEGKLHFHAALLNLKGEENKIAGHLFILMKTQDALYIYPQESAFKDKFNINFTSGETVLFARLRLVDASFPIPQDESKIFFKLLLFSKTGDLLHKEIFSFEVK